MSETGDFAAFMTARYDEAEALARAAMHDTRGEWNRRQDGPDWPTGHLRDDTDTIVVYDEGSPTDAEFDHIAACDPAHRLTDITLKRAILKLYTDTLALVEHPPLAHGPAAGEHARMRGLAPGTGMISARDYLDAKRELAVLEPVARQLGTEFSGHPEYRAEWKP